MLFQLTFFVCLNSCSEESMGIRILILPNADALRIAFNCVVNRCGSDKQSLIARKPSAELFLLLLSTSIFLSAPESRVSL